jgi:hypothetical protein
VPEINGVPFMASPASVRAKLTLIVVPGAADALSASPVPASNAAVRSFKQEFMVLMAI